MEETIKTKRGNVKYEHNGFLYVFHKFNKDGDIKFWRCEFCNTNDFNCKGRIHTDLQGNVLRQVGEHNCPSGAENIGKQRVITTLKKRAVATMEPPVVLRAQILENVATPILAQVPNKQAIKKIIKRARKQADAPLALPLNLTELHIPQNYQIYMRTEEDGEQFLLADSGVYNEGGREQRILVFGRESYGLWSREMKEVFADGTFSIAPGLFSQIYVILSRRRNWVFPVLYCLLSDKSQATYERMWTLITNMWPNFEPTSISLDYEAAAINSIRVFFPVCEIRGCLYHLTHNLKRKLAEEGLTQRYRADADFSVLCRMITAVAFLPIQDISNALPVKNLQKKLGVTGRLMHAS
uniref:MULE transposase domain-containing protein n=1 Tax=Meloidogyne incognita TaxID=6306 RepID=A0A914LRY3_MELIC